MSEPFEPARPSGASDLPSTMSAFFPILVLGLVLLGWFGFQSFELRAERDAMRSAIGNQDKPVADSKKLRESLDAIARGTAQLADGGNPNARLLVDELKRRGITISPNQPAAGLDAPAPPATPAAN